MGFKFHQALAQFEQLVYSKLQYKISQQLKKQSREPKSKMQTNCQSINQNTNSAAHNNISTVDQDKFNGKYYQALAQFEQLLYNILFKVSSGNR